MKLSIANIVIVLFILFTVGDILSTIMATSKHSAELETNPLNVAGIPLWLMFVIKIIIYAAFVWIISVRYPKMNIYLRYYIVFFLLLATILNMSVTITNFDVYNEPAGTLTPIPKEQRVAQYTEFVGDMKVVGAATKIVAPKQDIKIPAMFSLVIYNLLSFIVWVSFEKKYGLYGVK